MGAFYSVQNQAFTGTTRMMPTLLGIKGFVCLSLSKADGAVLPYRPCEERVKEAAVAANWTLVRPLSR